ncbi:hypothetical protein IWQ56_005982, partial [Coemansia nantahalensis]
MAEDQRGHGSTGEGFDLSSILPGGRSLEGVGSSSATHSMVSIPIDTDIDQLVKSLGDSVDTSKVSDDDIDKLLGSINADFSASLALPSAPARAANSTDPLALLNHTFGIGLEPSAGRLATSV